MMPSVHARKASLMSTVMSNLHYSKYGKVFRDLLAVGPAARRAFIKLVCKVIRREISLYCRESEQKLLMFTGSESVKSFSWSNMHNELRNALPTFYAAISSSMPEK